MPQVQMILGSLLGYHYIIALNGMLRQSLGGAVIFISLQHFFCPACKPEVQGIAIRAVGQVGLHNKFLGIFQVETLFQKCGPYCIRRPN